MKIITCDMANGPGFRVTIWLSGCRRHCKGCFNSCAWDFNAGKPFTKDTLKILEGELKKPWIKRSDSLRAVSL